MTDDHVEQKLADHLRRYEFRKRDDYAGSVGVAQIAMAAAAYTMKLAKRLGHDDLANELNAEVNEYLQSVEEQRQALSIEFEATGLGTVDRWYDPGTENPDV